jgi:Zn finger protein HypA/HybF involved in hydrogenase expression
MAKGGHLAKRIAKTNPSPVIGVIHLRNTKAKFYCRLCDELKSVTAVDGSVLRLECEHCRTMDNTVVNTGVNTEVQEEIAA